MRGGTPIIRAMRRQAGFTILELMIVVAIVGVLGSLALAGLREWNLAARRTAAVSDFLASMHIARSEAVKRNVRVGVCPADDPADANTKCSGSKDWAGGWIVFVDSDGDIDRAADEEILGTTAALGGVWTLISANSDVSLDFRPNGRVEMSTLKTLADFSLCDDRGPAEGRVISISNSGRPQAGLKAADGTDPAC